jgi:hypothetical protein
MPNASNLNYIANQTIPNAVITKIGSNGKVCIYTSAPTNIIADVNGWFPAANSFTGLEPARLLDTRPGGNTVDAQDASSGLRVTNSVYELQITGRGNVPTNAAAVALNVTVTGTTAEGYLTIWPCGTTMPNASNLNYIANQTIPNAVITKIGSNGKVCIYNSAPTNIIADVNGWFPDPTLQTANEAPTVSITSPLQGATVGADIMTRIEGTATDTDGTPTSVLVSINGNTAINSTVTDGRWQVDIAPPAGTWTLIVRSVDDQGLTSESASRTLTFSYPSPSETVINPYAISINPTQAASVILEVTETTVKFISGYTVDVGDILNIDPFTLAEDGALRKVLAITDTPSGRVVSTSQATLTDLILQIDIGGAQALNAQSTPDVQERRISAQSAKLFEAKRTLNGPDIPLKIGTRNLGAVKVSVILNLDVVGELEIGSEWCWCKDFVKVKKFLIKATGSISSTIEYAISTGEDGWSWNESKNLGAIPLPPFQLGPLTVIPRIESSVFFRGEISAALSVNLTRTVSVSLGIEYDDGNWNTIWVKPTTTTSSTLNFSGIADAQAGLNLNLVLLAGGAIGPQISADIYGYINATINGTLSSYGFVTAHAEYGIGITPKVGVRFKVFKWDLVDREWPIADIRWTIWERDWQFFNGISMGTLEYDTLATAKTLNPGQVMGYSFDGTIGDIISVGATPSSYSTISVLTSVGVLVSGCNTICKLPSTGTYYAVLKLQSYAPTTTLSMHIAHEVTALTADTPIELGADLPSGINRIFSINIQQPTKANISVSEGDIDVYNSNMTGGFSCTSLCTFATAGIRYAVLSSSYYPRTATTTIAVSTPILSLQYDSPYTVTSIIPRGIAKVFTWTGNVGDVVSSGAASSAVIADFDLYNPDGTEIGDDLISSCFYGCKLTQSGTYFAVLRNSTGSIPVGVKAHISTPIELTNDQTYSIPTAITPNVPAMFVATVAAGSPLSFSGHFYARVTNSNMSSVDCGQLGVDFCIAPTTGKYYFLINYGTGFASGSKFTVSTTSISVPLGVPTSLGIAIPSYTNQIFSFTGAAGDAISPQKFGYNIRDIYKSDGTGLICTVFCKLPVSGTYYLVAQSYTNRSASDQVLISKAEPYSVGTVFSFTSESEFNSFHRFYAAAGQRLTLTSSKNATVYSIPNWGWNYRNICTTSNSSATCTFTDAGYYYVSVGNNGSTIPSGTTFSLTAA